MKKIIKLLTTALLVSAMLLTGGCGKKIRRNRLCKLFHENDHTGRRLRLHEAYRPVRGGGKRRLSEDA